MTSFFGLRKKNRAVNLVMGVKAAVRNRKFPTLLLASTLLQDILMELYD